MASILNGVRELREERSWTQSQLAAAVDVSRQSINNLERGRYVPSLELAIRLGRLFECPVDEIFWLESDESVDQSNQSF